MVTVENERRKLVPKQNTYFAFFLSNRPPPRGIPKMDNDEEDTVFVIKVRLGINNRFIEEDAEISYIPRKIVRKEDIEKDFMLADV